MSLLFLLSVAYAVLLVHNHLTSLGKRERQGAPSHCLPDSVPLAPRQGRSPAPPFPLIFGFMIAQKVLGDNCRVGYTVIKALKEMNIFPGIYKEQVIVKKGEVRFSLHNSS